MAKFCPNCGAGLAEGAKFCLGCGAKVEGIPAAPAQPEVSQQQPLQSQPQQPMPIQTTKKSKTKLIAVIAIILVAIIVAAVLLLVVLQEDTSKFIGTWNVEYLEGSTNPNLEWTFNQNGTLSSKQPGYDPNWYDYEISGGRLCLSSNEYTYYHCYDYKFSNGGNSLTLSAGGDTAIVLSKA